MAAKERHKQKVKQRLHERLQAINSQEEILHSIIRDYVQKMTKLLKGPLKGVAEAQTRAQDLLATEDTSYFMQQYGSVEQLLDRVNNTCELLSTTAEDMIETAELDVSVKPDSSLFTNSVQFPQHSEKISGQVADKSYQIERNPRTSTPDSSLTSPKNEEIQKTFKDLQASNTGSIDEVQKISTHVKCHLGKKDEEIKRSLEAMLHPKSEESDAATSNYRNSKAEKNMKTDSLYKTNTAAPLNELTEDKSKKLHHASVSSNVKQRVFRTIPDPVKKTIASYIGENVIDKSKGNVDKTEPIVNFERNTSTPVDDNVASFEPIIEHDETMADHVHDNQFSMTGKNYKIVDSFNFGNDLSLPKTSSIASSYKPDKVISKGRSDKVLIRESPSKINRSKAVPAEENMTKSTGILYNINSSEIRERNGAEALQIEQSTLPSGKILPVVVSDIGSPWCFCVQFNPAEVNHLMEQICTYMSHHGLHKDPLTNPQKGQFCLAKFSKDTTYYRAYILQCFDTMKEVEVLFIDYGNRERVKNLYLRDLPYSFYSIPMQAVCCALAEVMPNNKYMLWTEEDSLMFRQYAMNQQLNCVQACKCSTPGVPLIVRLYGSYPIPALPGGSVIFNQIVIGEMLVNRGSAKYVNTVDQIGHLQKSGEGQEESLVLNKSASQGSVVEIHELASVTLDKNRSDDTGKHKPTMITNKVQQKNSDLIENKFTTTTIETKDLKTEQFLNHKGPDNKSVVRESEIHSKSPRDTSDAGKDTTLDIGKDMNSEVNSFCNRSIDTVNMENKSDASTLKADMDSDSLSYKVHEDTDVNIDTETCTQTDQTTANRTVEENTNKLPRERSGYADSETMSSAGTTDMESEWSTDTGFQSTEVTFDLQLDPEGEKVMLAHVKSPTHFYVHVLQAGSTLDLLMRSLNKHFEKMNRRKLTRLSQTFIPVVNKLCCAQFLQDNNFYRAVILNIRSDTEPGIGKVHVHYIDFGDQEWLPKRRLFPLPPHYSSVPPLAIRCKLAYIKPVDTDDNVQMESKDYQWSESCTKAFVDLVGFEKVLHMQVVEGHLTSDNKGELVGNDNEILGVYLIDTSGSEEVCANMDLIRQNHAVLEISANRKGLQDENANDELDLNAWNPMEADFLSKRNSYKVDTEDIEIATLGYKSQPHKGVCRYFSNGANCWRGESCPYRHVQSDSVVPLEREEVYCVDNQILPKVHSWVAAEVMTILTPGHFYINLPMGNKPLDGISIDSGQDENANLESQETLDDLLIALNEEYSKKSVHDRSLQLKALGEIVVARFSQDKQWYRARVIEVTEDRVKVFYLDFGNTEWIPEDEVVEIMPEFLHLPFQAVECFLCNVEPAEDENWSAEAKSSFRSLVDGKTLVAHIRSRFWSGSLSVDLYDTSGDNDINIGDSLIQDGHAVRSISLTDSSCNASFSSQSERTNSELSEIIVPG